MYLGVTSKPSSQLAAQQVGAHRPRRELPVRRARRGRRPRPARPAPRRTAARRGRAGLRRSFGDLLQHVVAEAQQWRASRRLAAGHVAASAPSRRPAGGRLVGQRRRDEAARTTSAARSRIAQSAEALGVRRPHALAARGRAPPGRAPGSRRAASCDRTSPAPDAIAAHGPGCRGQQRAGRAPPGAPAAGSRSSSSSAAAALSVGQQRLGPLGIAMADRWPAAQPSTERRRPVAACRPTPGSCGGAARHGPRPVRRRHRGEHLAAATRPSRPLAVAAASARRRRGSSPCRTPPAGSTSRRPAPDLAAQQAAARRAEPQQRRDTLDHPRHEPRSGQPGQQVGGRRRAPPCAGRPAPPPGTARRPCSEPTASAAEEGGAVVGRLLGPGRGEQVARAVRVVRRAAGAAGASAAARPPVCQIASSSSPAPTAQPHVGVLRRPASARARPAPAGSRLAQLGVPRPSVQQLRQRVVAARAARRRRAPPATPAARSACVPAQHRGQALGGAGAAGGPLVGRAGGRQRAAVERRQAGRPARWSAVAAGGAEQRRRRARARPGRRRARPAAAGAGAAAARLALGADDRGRRASSSHTLIDGASHVGYRLDEPALGPGAQRQQARRRPTRRTGRADGRRSAPAAPAAARSAARAAAPGRRRRARSSGRPPAIGTHAAQRQRERARARDWPPARRRRRPSLRSSVASPGRPSSGPAAPWRALIERPQRIGAGEEDQLGVDRRARPTAPPSKG